MNPLITKLEMIAVLLPEDRQTLTELGRATQVVNKGRDIVREGEKPTHVYVLLNGWAARYTVLRDGSRQIMAFLLPGDVCNGKITILGKMDHSVVALSPVTVAAIERDAFIAGTQNRPNLAEAFWRITLVEEAILRAWIANLGRRGAYARVAHLICELLSASRDPACGYLTETPGCCAAASAFVPLSRPASRRARATIIW